MTKVSGACDVTFKVDRDTVDATVIVIVDRFIDAGVCALSITLRLQPRSLEMISSHASGNLAITVAATILFAGCGTPESSTGPGSPNADVGGAIPTGGATHSSARATGGNIATAGAVGQQSQTGGNSGQAGAGTSNTKAAATGGTSSVGGSLNTGGRSSTGGVTAGGGASSNGGKSSVTTGGTPATGGTKAMGGISSTGGGGSAGEKSTGGASSSSGGSKTTGGTTSSGGNKATGGAANSSDCGISITSSGVSTKIATVGFVEWSATTKPSSANVVYSLNNAGTGILNKGGTAPVDLTASNYRTLLLGLKPSSSYTAHVEAKFSDGSSCNSPDFAVTTTTLSGAPNITRSSKSATAQATGFIVTTTASTSGNGPAVIIDADGTVVWSYSSTPANCSRVRMDYEGANLWMMALNVMNSSSSSGEMRYVSMDGVTSKNAVSGLAASHHDFTVLKGGIIATLAWAQSGGDQPSQLIEYTTSSGTAKKVLDVGSNLYAGGQSVLGGGSNTYHANSISYHQSDDSYTIGDRNPNVFVKVTRAGSPVWQFGGSCSGAKAPKCVAGSWQVNHGHHLLEDGKFLFFNNGSFGGSTASHAFEYTLSTTSSMTATLVKDYSGSNYHSDSEGDVQRLPNGNTLITYSNKGAIVEVDSSWNVVQTLTSSSGAFGYADWRETLYGAPSRQ